MASSKASLHLAFLEELLTPVDELFGGPRLQRKYGLQPHLAEYHAKRLAIKHDPTMGRYEKHAAHQELRHTTAAQMAQHIQDQGGDPEHAHRAVQHILRHA